MQIICTYTCTHMYYNYSSAVLIMTVYTFFITSLAVRLASTEPYNLILPPYSYLFAILHADYMYLHMYTHDYSSAVLIMTVYILHYNTLQFCGRALLLR